MNDDFLSGLKHDPDPGFAARLRERLRRHEPPRALPGVRWKPALATAAALAVAIALFAFPSVRASAQAVLDLFRVRNFAAVKFDPARAEALRAQARAQDNPLLMVGEQKVLKDPGPPVEVGSIEAAGARAGIDVQSPRGLPSGLTLQRVTVEGEAEARLTADAGKLRALLQSLDIRDLDVPSSIDGQSVTVRKPPIVILEYRSDRRRAVMVQARSPEIELPAGLDLPRLAEIGMRVIGVDAAQARHLAHTVDWHSTLVVPVPANASSFRSVEIHGDAGLLVTTPGETRADGTRGRAGTLVLWSEGDRVFAVMGDLDPMTTMQIAESVQ
jgi:hypothetical protein